ncbi:MAG: penicillin-binding protein activator [Hyphomicrobiaceae bacterium]
MPAPPAPGATAAAGSSAQVSATSATAARLRPEARIALLLPLTGNTETAAVAKGMRQAGEMALFQINNPGFQLVVKDTRASPDGARAAAQEAIAEGAEMIVGPLFAASVTAVAPVARQAGVPVLAFSNDKRIAGSGVYLLSFLVGAEVDRVVGFAVARGKRRFAALLPDDAYGVLAGDAFRAAVARYGGTIVASARYQGGANGMLGPAQQLIEAVRGAEEQGVPVDAIFVPGGPETLPRLGPILRHGRLDTAKVKLLGTGGWDYPGLGRDQTFVGAWYPTPDPRGWRAFSEQFGRTFGSAPPRIASLAHDAVSIAAVLAGAAPKGQRYAPGQLTQARGFTGVDGPVRLGADGTAERSLAVVEVQPFGATVIDAAPGMPGAAPVGAPPPFASAAPPPFAPPRTAPQPVTATGPQFTQQPRRLVD